MRLSEYQAHARRTLPPNDNERDGLNLGALGLGGESGEVVDLIKKILYHGVPLDRDKLKKEMGDVLWYLAAIGSAAGISLDDVAEANVAKLRARFPDGFTHAAAQAKADERSWTRCPFLHDGRAQCVLPAGHDGRHTTSEQP